MFPIESGACYVDYGMIKSSFRPISRAIPVMTQYGHSYDEKRIGTRMRSVEWCHFQ